MSLSAGCGGYYVDASMDGWADGRIFQNEDVRMSLDRKINRVDTRRGIGTVELRLVGW